MPVVLVYHIVTKKKEKKKTLYKILPLYFESHLFDMLHKFGSIYINFTNHLKRKVSNHTEL